MTHFSNNPNHVRAEFFKPLGGKWYMTNELIIPDGQYNSIYIADNIRKACIASGINPDNWIINVNEPYSVYQHPQLLLPPSMRKALKLSW